MISSSSHKFSRRNSTWISFDLVPDTKCFGRFGRWPSGNYVGFFCSISLISCRFRLSSDGRKFFTVAPSQILCQTGSWCTPGLLSYFTDCLSNWVLLNSQDFRLFTSSLCVKLAFCCAIRLRTFELMAPSFDRLYVELPYVWFGLIIRGKNAKIKNYTSTRSNYKMAISFLVTFWNFCSSIFLTIS